MILFNLVLSGVLVGGIYALFALGLSLLLGVMRVFNLAHGAVFTIAALMSITIARHTGWPWELLALTGAVTGLVLAVPLELLAIRPFRRVGVSREDMENSTLLATLGLLYVANAVMVDATDAAAWNFPAGTIPTTVVSIGGIGLNIMYYIDFAIAVVLIGLVAAFVRWSQHGRAIRGIASDHRAAGLLGINVGAYSFAVTALSSALAGIGGVLLALIFNSVAFNFGDSFLFQGFAIVVLGGAGSVVGTLIAALGLAVVQGVASYYTGGSWAAAIAFGVLVLVLAIRPQGLMGRRDIVRA